MAGAAAFFGGVALVASFATSFAGGVAFATSFAGGVAFAAGAFFAGVRPDCGRRCIGFRPGVASGEVLSSFAGAWKLTAGAAFERRGARSAGLLGDVG